jgi:acyl-CoA reductase-like NAD-dependent aldehyde dehydrogenase
MPSFAFSHSDAPALATPIEEVDRIVAHVASRKASWVGVGLDERVRLLEGLSRQILAHQDRWAGLVHELKSALPDDPGYLEGLQNIWVSARGVRRVRETLTTLRDTGRPPEPPGGWSTRGDGRVVAGVFPSGLWDHVLLKGMRGEVWFQPGLSREQIVARQAAAVRSPSHPEGRLMLVLGAGNQSSIPFLDAIHALFSENCVVVLKMNPVNASLGPVLRDIFAELVAGGWFEVVYGGVDVGRHLTSHPLVDRIHITGSDATHDAIVWGPAEGRAERKARGEKLLHKPITSELGNVSPMIVAGGEWSERDFRFNVAAAALGVVHNASFNCIATKVLVLPRKWPQRERFLAELRDKLREARPRKAFYPGAHERWQQFVDAHPEAEVLGARRDDSVPWTLIPNLDPEARDEICFTREAFCGVLAEVSLPGDSPAEFLANATAFCNERLWGTLAASIFVHPSIRRDPVGEAAFQLALDELRYGGIAVNTTKMGCYGMPSLPWGAHPGHSLEEIGSGLGHVHNALMFEGTQKGVVYADWNYGLYGVLTYPPFFFEHKKARETYDRMARFEADPRVTRLPGIFLKFLTG